MSRVRSYLDKKIRCVRWGPAYDNGFLVASGSWGSERNSVAIHCISASLGGGADARNVSDKEKESVEGDGVELCSSDDLAGDVCDIDFLNSKHLLVATSSGQVQLMMVSKDKDVEEKKKGHVGKAGKVTSAAKDLRLSIEKIAYYARTGGRALHAGNFVFDFSRGDCFITAGEDGVINSVNFATGQVESYANTLHDYSLQANGSPAYAIQEMGLDSFLVGGMNGKLVQWDQRTMRPVSSGSHPQNPRTVTCIAKHPSNMNIICTGTMDGAVLVWDVRKLKNGPIKEDVLAVSPVWQVEFLPWRPTSIVCCSEEGLLYELDFNKENADPSTISFEKANVDRSVLVESNFSINSLHCLESKRHIVCASDAMTICSVKK